MQDFGAAWLKAGLSTPFKGAPTSSQMQLPDPGAMAASLIAKKRPGPVFPGALAQPLPLARVSTQRSPDSLPALRGDSVPSDSSDSGGPASPSPKKTRTSGALTLNQKKGTNADPTKA
jgi:hypothetical protein